MRCLTTTTASLLATVALIAADDKVQTYHFCKENTGKLPPGWSGDKTGSGEGSVWKVVEDKTAPSKTGYVLAQTAQGPNALFNLCVVDDSKFKDVEISVSFKAVAGDKDRGGGIVWRYQDHNNYYLARMNPLEDNFRVYKVVDGKRTQFESADVKIPSGEWHTIKIETTGEKITCYLDGKKYLEAKDATFADAGKVGLWSKADAQTYFDEFRVSAR
jgi:hypothetical protein